MVEDKLKWCCKQTKGIRLVELKPHLSESYLNEANESLDVCCKLDGKWKLISGYYACYNAFYSLLMKVGIKCEIHDCSIELMELFGFQEDDIMFLRKLKADRIQTQYYLKNILLKDENLIKKFVCKCKEILEGLDSGKIENIRRKLKEYEND